MTFKCVTCLITLRLTNNSFNLTACICLFLSQLSLYSLVKFHRCILCKDISYSQTEVMRQNSSSKLSNYSAFENDKSLSSRMIKKNSRQLAEQIVFNYKYFHYIVNNMIQEKYLKCNVNLFLHPFLNVFLVLHPCTNV